MKPKSRYTDASVIIILVWKPKPYEVDIRYRDKERERVIRPSFKLVEFDALKMNDMRRE